MEHQKWHLGTVASKQDFANVIKCGELFSPYVFFTIL